MLCQEEAAISGGDIVLSSEQYAALRERVALRLFGSIERAFAEEGLPFDRDAFLAQTSYDQHEIVNQLLVLGSNVSIGEDDPQAPEREPVLENVVSLESARQKRAAPSALSPVQIAARFPFDFRRLALTVAMVSLVPMYSFADINGDGLVWTDDLPGLVAKLEERQATNDQTVTRILNIKGERMALKLRRLSPIEYEVISTAAADTQP